MKRAYLLCWCFIVLGMCILASREAIGDSLTLTIGSASITFPSVSPAIASSIAAVENPIGVSVDYTGAATWAVTMIATSDLIGSSGSIPISSVRFTGTGVSDTSGTLSTMGKTIASGTFTPVPETGSLSFFFNNSWTNPAGTYSTSIVITATSL